MNCEDRIGTSHVSQTRMPTTHPLRLALIRLRWRWWVAALARALLLTLMAGTATLILTWPVRWWLGSSGPAWASDNLLLTLTVVGAAMLATFIVALTVLAVRAPSLLTLAQRCDRALDEKQRLSTAFEVLEREGPQPVSMVPMLLLQDVEHRLPSLPLRRAVRATPPTRLYASLLGLAAFASLAVAVPVPKAPVSLDPIAAQGPVTELLTPDSAEETIELAETIAENLAAEPISQRDPFLRAVSEGFAELAVQLRDDAISVEEANQIVADLLSFLDDAVERTGGSLEETVREAMPEGIDRGRGEDSNASIPSFGSQTEEGDEEEGRAVPDRVDNRPDAQSSEASGGSALERLADALERRAEEREANALEGPTETFSGDSSNPYGNQVNVVRESTGEVEPGMEPLMRAEAGGAGRAAGAAQESSEAAGDAAGGGSAELLGDAEDFSQENTQVELTPIEAGNQSDGQRIEMTLTPSEDLLADRAVTENPPERYFDRTNEQGTPSQTLGWTQRDVVCRYFLPQSAREDSEVQ